MAKITDPAVLERLARGRETARKNREARRAATQPPKEPEPQKEPEPPKVEPEPHKVEPEKIETQKEPEPELTITQKEKPKTKEKEKPKTKKKVVYIDDETSSSDSDEIVITRRKRIPKEEPKEVRRFSEIMGELTLASDGIIMKSDRMVLPKSLQDMASELAHHGAHPGRSGIERRLRFHFFFHNMFEKVQDFVEKCEFCSTFVDKKTKEPIKPHMVPEKCWEAVAVDLFGPMPSSKHVVVVQDIGSRYPAAKLVSSTGADKVIPALGEIYDTFGNPEVQISDNGPPFNSTKLKKFVDQRGITPRHVPPYFPNANPSETFMKQLGKQ